MSRALYHLSYGTACGSLPSGLDARLQLALLTAVLVDGDALSLVHCLEHESIEVLGIEVAEVGFEPTTFGL
jgi:hypothetical protein